jgi:HK97 family phage major capsid protein
MSEFPALKDALGKLDAARKSLKDVFSEAGPDYDMSKVKSLPGDSSEKLGWIRTKNEEIEGLKVKVDELKAVANAASEAAKYEEGRETVDAPATKGGRVGDLFVKSHAYSRRDNQVKVSLDIDLKGLFAREDLGGSETGWPPESVRSGRVELTPQRPAPHVTDFLPKGTINQAAYKYMEETTFSTNSAASDNLAGMTDEGGTFTEAQLGLTERTQSVEKVTVWIPVTDEQLEDEAGARDYLNNRLTYMINAKVDSQVLAGSGTAPSLKGTENVSGIQTQAKGADTILDAVYKLFTSIRTDGFAEPNVVFINPSKWQEVALLKTADGQYIWGHPSSVGPVTVWGVPVVQSFAHTSTKAIAGDYATYSMLFAKRGLDVQVTNAHSDFFIKGKQAIRADARLVMVHFRPKAFGVVTGL